MVINLVKQLKKRQKLVETELNQINDSTPDNFIFIFKTNPIVHHFKSIDDKVIGFDGYFKGNFNRYPLFVISFVSQSLRALPLCLCLTNDAKKETIERLVRILIKEFDLQGYIVSIDNDDAEKYALNKNGIQYILCKFHLIKCIYLF